ncbi:histidinol-phosphate transaminase [Marinisporobacter balticus]|uniref:Histidinol-phosphate aminotransferase n=1 Tax=Marinisporobacter balticus TaxID=2018667 RepID=A0A4R2LJ40_9FIRM|nr:histidinol-phosphate transaminase [Marinisporobacter balticus]TCO79375.1 histidinol-phosphate aminotransferase [Marinisporobacter balticus]
MIELIKESVCLIKPYNVLKEEIDIKLDANENPFNIFEFLKEKFIKKISNLDMNRYPDTDSERLRMAFAKHVDVQEENILCANGSDEIIQMIINAFVDKDEYVITHSPTFSMYKIFTTIVGGKVMEVSSELSLEIDVEEIIKEANTKKAKVVFLCNPNNPTGTVIPREDIIRVIEETKAIVVVDEAYYEFLGQSVVGLINDYDRLIVLRTLSKAFALAGARVGYAIASEKMMDVLYRVKAPYNLNIFSQIAAELFVENIDLINVYLKKIIEEREYLLEALKKMDDMKTFPTGSNFILIKSAKAREILATCRKEGISLRNFGEDGLLKDCIRITVGTREENNKVINLLKDVV